MFSTQIDVLALATLALCVFSNAAPLNGTQRNSPLVQLVSRGGVMSHNPVISPAKCSINLADAIARSKIDKEQLAGKALFFFSPVDPNQVKAIAKEKGKYRFQDLYPTDVVEEVEGQCGLDGLELLCRAMGSLASGEAMVVSQQDPLQVGNLSKSRFWRAELEAMREGGEVKTLHVLNPKTNKVVQVSLNAYETPTYQYTTRL